MSDWRNRLSTVLRNHLGSSKDDEPAVQCALAVLSAYITARKALLLEQAPDDDVRAGIADMLSSLTSGLLLGNPFWARNAVMLAPMLAVVNLNLSYAYRMIDSDREGRNPDITARVVEAVNMIYQFPLLVLFLHSGQAAAEQRGAQMRREIEAIFQIGASK